MSSALFSHFVAAVVQNLFHFTLSYCFNEHERVISFLYTNVYVNNICGSRLLPNIPTYRQTCVRPYTYISGVKRCMHCECQIWHCDCVPRRLLRAVRSYVIYVYIYLFFLPISQPRNQAICVNQFLIHAISFSSARECILTWNSENTHTQDSQFAPGKKGSAHVSVNQHTICTQHLLEFSETGQEYN